MEEEPIILTSEMKYLIVCETLEGSYKCTMGLFHTLEEAKQWRRENEAEFANYIIYKIAIDNIMSPFN